MSRVGLVSAMAMAALSPPRLRPQARRHGKGSRPRLFRRDELVDQHVAVVPHDPVAERAVMILVPDALAPAGVERFLRDDDFVVLILVGFSVDNPAAGCPLALEVPVAFMSPLLHSNRGPPTRRNEIRTPPGASSPALRAADCGQSTPNERAAQKVSPPASLAEDPTVAASHKGGHISHDARESQPARIREVVRLPRRD